MLSRGLIPLGLIAATWLVLGQVVLFDFVDYDDPVYVTGNPHVIGGMQPANLVWALTTNHDGNWFPLTWMSLMLDAELFGLDANGFHLTNLILHTLNVLLLYAVLQSMTQQTGPSAFVALLFAVHPLHVEPVAWVTERKELLAACFALAALWTYSRYATFGGRRWYAWTLLAFLGSLLSKQMWVTLPFVLLLLDYWPLRRIAGLSPSAGTANDGAIKTSRTADKRSGKVASSGSVSSKRGKAAGSRQEGRLSVGQLLREKIPFFALTGLFCVAVLALQSGEGSVRSLSQLSMSTRFLNAVTVYVIYIRKAFWPVDLAFFYPHPGESISTAYAAAAGLLLLAITAWTVYERRSRPFLITGWLWYLGTLVPVIGLVQVGRQQMADRYTYIPLIGLSIAVTWGVCSLVPDRSFRPKLLAVLAGFVLIPMMVLSYRQASYWRNSIRLFSHALEVTQDNAVAHTSLGVALQANRRLAESAAHQREAIRIDPDQAMYHYNLASVLVAQEQYAEAIEEFQAAIELQPASALPHYQLGSLYYRQGDNERAVESLRTAVAIDPEFAEAHLSLGRLLTTLGDEEGGNHHLQEAQRLRPDRQPEN